MIREYHSPDLTVYWEPSLCNKAGVCVRALPQVFRPKERPWVKIDGASALEIIHVIDHCPTGALKYSLPEGSRIEPLLADGPGRLRPDGGLAYSATIKVVPDGPFLVEGEVAILNAEGKVINASHKTALCRCGQSQNQPFCDGIHRKIGFKAP